MDYAPKFAPNINSLECIIQFPIEYKTIYYQASP